MSTYAPEPIPACAHRIGDTVLVPAPVYRTLVHATIESIDRDAAWGDTLVVTTPGDRWQVAAADARTHDPADCRGIDYRCAPIAEQAA